MARKVMKIFVLMMMMVLAILAGAAVQANNPLFFDNLFLNHPPPLTSLSHSPPIISLSLSLSPYHDAKFRGNPSKGKENLGSKNTRDEKKRPGSELTYSEKVCLDNCRKLLTYPRLSDPFLKMSYLNCIRSCLRY